MLRIKHRLPPIDSPDYQESVVAIGMVVMNIVDYISQGLSKDALGKVASIRQVAINTLDRKDEEFRKVEMSNAKFAARKARLEEVQKTASPEALRKSEEKEKKRDARRSAMKRMKKVKQ